MPELDATPSKHVFDALAADVSPIDAISDLVDNSLDNWRAARIQQPLEIRLTLEENRICIEDNAGGIDDETIALLLMPGGSKWGGGEGIKGIWGIGAKRALFALGKRFSITTRAAGEEGIVLDVDEEWFEEDDSDDKWMIEYEIDNSIEEGTTVITIEDLKTRLNTHRMTAIRKELIDNYRDEIEGETLRLFFNEELVIVGPEVSWAISDYAPPSKYIMELPVFGSERTLHVEIVAGIMTSPGGDYTYGIDFIGNRRLVLKYNLDQRMGFVKERLGGPHPTINRFRAIVRVDGESKDIPWNSAKNDINPNHPMYSALSDFIFQVSRQYVGFLRKNYKVTSRLFRQQATSDDFQNVELGSLKDFRSVVEPYVEPKKDVVIRFPVPPEDYDELIEYFGFKGKSKKDVGLFIFYHVLREVVRGDEG
ncbi:MAG: ATP-binding protein [Candidatus Thorarchaeota archaeon]|jgi:hypothetical protein